MIALKQTLFEKITGKISRAKIVQEKQKEIII